jgi:hypothetical protein
VKPFNVRLSLVLCAALVAFAGPVFAQDAHVALFKNVTGSIKIQREGATLDAAAGTTLMVSDRIVSGPNANGGVVFKDGTLLTVGPSTELQVRDYVFEPADAKYAFALYLAKGSAIYSSGKIGKIAPEAVNVSTPTTTVGVRGTRFIIKAE